MDFREGFFLPRLACFALKCAFTRSSLHTNVLTPSHKHLPTRTGVRAGKGCQTNGPDVQKLVRDARLVLFRREGPSHLLVVCRMKDAKGRSRTRNGHTSWSLPVA